MIITITTLIFIVASIFITHFVIIENYHDKMDAMISYGSSVLMFGLLGACIGYFIDSIFLIIT